MAESLYTGVTIQGLYSDQTGDQLFGVLGTTAPASALYLAGQDYGTGFLTALSTSANGYLNVNASIAPPSDTIVTGALTNPTDAVPISTTGTSALMVQLTAGPITAGNIDFQVSLDGTTWQAAKLYPVFPDGTPSATSTATVPSNWTLFVGGVQKFRVVADGTFASTTPVAVVLTAGQGQYSVEVVSPIAANFLATVNQGTSPWVTSVSGTVAVTQSTSPWVVSLTSTTITGTVAVTQSTSPWVVSGNLTHNNAAPTADNVGVLPALANAAAPTFTEGDQVLLSTDLAGNLRTTATFSGTVTVAGNLTNNTAAPIADNVGVLPALAATSYTTNTYTTGFQVLPVTDLHGALNEDLQAVAGVQLGATAVTAFGTAPAAANVQGVNASIYAGTTALTATGSSLNTNVTNTVTVTGTVAVTQSTSPWVVAGGLTNNNAAPSTNNVGVLPAIAVSGTFPAVTTPTLTAGDQQLVTVSQGGSLISIPADEEYASHISYYSADTGNVLKTVTTGVVFPLVSIRSSSAAFQFLVREVQGFTDGTQELIQLLKNPTLTGSTFAATAPSGSHVTVDTAATAVSASGTVVWSGFASSAPASINNILSSLAAGTPGDIYTVACQKFGTGTSKAGGQIFWSEVAAAI